MARISPAHLALREATASRHDTLDRSLGLSQPGAGREAYVRHVAALHDWLAPREQDLWSGPWPAEVEAGARAVKRGWLEEDLAAARGDGYGVASLRGEVPLPFAGLAERMGFAYVIEGSMLGAQVLLRRLEGVLAPWPVRWLHGYGAEGSRRWRDFLDALSRRLASPAEIGLAARAAERAFDELAGAFARRAAFTADPPVNLSESSAWTPPASDPR